MAFNFIIPTLRQQRTYRYMHQVLLLFFGKFFFEFAKLKSADDITDSLVREFRLYLNRQSAGNNRATGKTLTKKTQNYYLIAIRMFLKYLTKRGVESMHADQIDLAKVSERSLDLITPVELSRLLEAPKDSDIKSLRDKAILELLFSTGLRVSELCSLTNDLDLNADEFSIRGKGGKVRVVFMSEEARKAKYSGTVLLSVIVDSEGQQGKLNDQVDIFISKKAK